MHAAGCSGSSTQAYAQVAGHAHVRVPRTVGTEGLRLHSFPSEEFMRNCIIISGAGLAPTVLECYDDPRGQSPFKEQCAQW